MRPFFAIPPLALMLFAQPAHAQVRCAESIDAKLAELSVQKSSVKEIATTRYGTIEGGFQGYRGWIRLDSCRGYLVMEVTGACLVTTMHTTGTCKVPGVPAY